ncbi:MAG: hypothetical protein RL685_687 [Pseudomonadota bacterium]|jgi:hypothetical protein
MSPRGAHASVRIAGESLDPLEVTRALRLPPDHVHRSGEPRIQRRPDGSLRELAPYRQGMWSMNSERWVFAPELDVHIRWLLDQLEPRRVELQRLLAGGAGGGIFCYSSDPGDEATPIPGSTLGRCVALSLPVEIDRRELDDHQLHHQQADLRLDADDLDGDQ